LHILRKSTLTLIFVQSNLFLGCSAQGLPVDDGGEAILETHLHIADGVSHTDNLTPLSLPIDTVPPQHMREGLRLWREWLHLASHHREEHNKHNQRKSDQNELRAVFHLTKIFPHTVASIFF
jgi:hypothetical protein